MLLTINTDGACRGNGSLNSLGGYGVVLRYGTTVKELSGFKYNTTNNAMEIIAAIKGLEAVTNRSAEVLLISDSAYVINCMNAKWYVKWSMTGWKNSKGEPVANKALWVELIKIRETFDNLKFKHVKGHSGDVDNERCDVLANIAMDGAADDTTDDLAALCEPDYEVDEEVLRNNALAHNFTVSHDEYAYER